MYSQCPQCQAIFNVPEAHIGAHQGLVRCGRCQAIFHALTNKVDGLEVLNERRPDTSESGKPASGPDVERDRPSVQTPAPALARREAPSIDREPPSAPAVISRDEAVAPPDGGPAGTRKHDNSESARRHEDTANEEPADVSPAATETPEDDVGQERPEPSADDAQPGPDWIEPSLPEPGEADADSEDEGFAGEVEEILIEAPPVLWNVFDDETVDPSVDVEALAAGQAVNSAVGGEPATGAAPAASRPGAASKGDRPAAGGRQPPFKSPYRARDVRMVELPQPRPFKTASLSLLSVFLVLLLVWQVKTFYLDDLAQYPIARPYLEIVCRALGCAVPPRRAFAEIDLVGTSINVNPEVPGALEITASLMNRAHFPQPYPPLRVTLTDRDGRIVGRRTYLPSEYRQDGASRLLPIKAKRDVAIDLAQPAENAVGYEVELVAPVSQDTQ